MPSHLFVKERQVVEGGGDLGMVWAQGLLNDGQCSTVEGLSFGVFWEIKNQKYYLFFLLKGCFIKLEIFNKEI